MTSAILMKRTFKDQEPVFFVYLSTEVVGDGDGVYIIGIKLDNTIRNFDGNYSEFVGEFECIEYARMYAEGKLK